MAGAPEIGPSLSAESRAFFAQVTGLLGAAGIPFSLNPRLVRGLDYYAHTTFELWHESLQGAQNALGGGGRYDGLAEVLGFPATPGTGYALGVERTLAVCRSRGWDRSRGASGSWSSASGRRQARRRRGGPRELREAGIAAVLDASDRRLDRRLAGAARQGARGPWCWWGRTEAAAGAATWKDLDTGRQETAAVDEVARRAAPPAAGG